MNTTMCRVIINEGINPTDRELLARSFAKLDIGGSGDRDGGAVTMTVEADDWSTLCILEDFDILTAEQI